MTKLFKNFIHLIIFQLNTKLSGNKLSQVVDKIMYYKIWFVATRLMRKWHLIIGHKSIHHLPLPLFSCLQVVAKNLLPSITKSSFPSQICSPWEKLSNMQNIALKVEGNNNSTLRWGEFHYLVNPMFRRSMGFPLLLLVTLSISHPWESLQPKTILYTFLRSLCQFLLVPDVD